MGTANRLHIVAHMKKHTSTGTNRYRRGGTEDEAALPARPPPQLYPPPTTLPQRRQSAPFPSSAVSADDPAAQLLRLSQDHVHGGSGGAAAGTGGMAGGKVATRWPVRYQPYSVASPSAPPSATPHSAPAAPAAAPPQTTPQALSSKNRLVHLGAVQLPPTIRSDATSLDTSSTQEVDQVPVVVAVASTGSTSAFDLQSILNP